MCLLIQWESLRILSETVEKKEKTFKLGFTFEDTLMKMIKWTVELVEKKGGY